MQLQRSLFSFYKVFVKKTPLALWLLLGILLLVIITWQIWQFITVKPVYNFDQCMLEFFNLTRSIPNNTEEQIIEQNKTELNGTSNITAQKGSGKKPFFLESKFYTFLNQTTTIKLYLSEKIQYKQSESNCKIIFNIQKLRHENFHSDIAKKDTLDQMKQPEKKTQNEKTESQVKLLQQAQGQQNHQTQQNEDSKAKAEQVKIQKKPNWMIAEVELPPHIRHYDNISAEQKEFLLNEHSFMHITGNQHVAYLNQDNQFEEKHNVQIHAIILSQQQFDEYPISWLGISSRFWRFHGNQFITKNGNMLRSMGQTFSKVSEKIKQIYVKALFSVNLLISEKKLLNSVTEANDAQRQKAKEKSGNLKKQEQTQEKKDGEQIKTQVLVSETSQNSTNETAKTKAVILAMMQQLPNELIQPEPIYPLNSLKLYFHYPQTLRIEEIARLTMYVETSTRLFYKLVTVLLFFGSLFIISGLIGLLVRYVLFAIITLYLFMGGCLIHNQWGWVQKYYQLIKNRFNQTNALTSVKIILLFAIALIGSLFMFTFGIKYILTNIVIFTMSFSETYYAEMLLKNYFIIEMFYFVFCRSRVTLKYFPIFSIALSLLILFANERLYCYQISWLMNVHLIVHMVLMSIFMGVQNYIVGSQYYNDYTPSQSKPRALYYAAYDISWQNTIPPIWTYFTTYFDWRYFGQRERVLINKDYQMLYGRLLGMNERQQLPQDENEDEGRELNEHNISESNEMNLMR